MCILATHTRVHEKTSIGSCLIGADRYYLSGESMVDTLSSQPLSCPAGPAGPMTLVRKHQPVKLDQLQMCGSMHPIHQAALMFCSSDGRALSRAELSTDFLVHAGSLLTSYGTHAAKWRVEPPTTYP